MFLSIALVSFVFERIYNKGAEGRLRIDRFILAVPVLGDLMRKAAVSRFTRTLSTLLQSGVPAIQSLEITETVVGNRVDLRRHPTHPRSASSRARTSPLR